MTDLIESEDELLDPQPGPAAAAPPHRFGLAAAAHRLRERPPLGAGCEIDPARRRRMTWPPCWPWPWRPARGPPGCSCTAATCTPREAHAEDRMLLHLLGGGATLTFDAGGPGTGTASNLPGTFGAPLNAYFTLALRNDGAKPLQVTGVGIWCPGWTCSAGPRSRPSRPAIPRR